MKGSLVAALVALTIAAAPLYAENKSAARAAYADGTRYYDLGQYTEALEAFKRAYWNYEEPAFLFNIAQCHRVLGHDADALGFYRSYLRKLPVAPNRDGVERIIAGLEESLARKKAEADAAQQAALTAQQQQRNDLLVASAPPPRKPLYKRWWLWTAVGVVAAGAATAIAVGVTQSRASEATLNPVTVQ